MSSDDPLQDALVRGLQARNRLLLIHALIGIEVGLFIVFTGAPLMVEERWGPISRILLGAQSFLPGGVLLAAVAVGLGNRVGRWMAVAGALGLIVWQITMAIIFIIQALDHGAFLNLGEPMTEDTALSYVFWVYVNLAALMSVHLVEIFYSTFWREWSSQTIRLGRGPH